MYVYVTRITSPTKNNNNQKTLLYSLDVICKYSYGKHIIQSTIIWIWMNWFANCVAPHMLRIWLVSNLLPRGVTKWASCPRKSNLVASITHASSNIRHLAKADTQGDSIMHHTHTHTLELKAAKMEHEHLFYVQLSFFFFLYDKLKAQDNQIFVYGR